MDFVEFVYSKCGPDILFFCCVSVGPRWLEGDFWCHTLKVIKDINRHTKVKLSDKQTFLIFKMFNISQLYKLSETSQITQIYKIS